MDFKATPDRIARAGWTGADCTSAQALVIPFALATLMLVSGIFAASLATISIRALILPYFSTADACTLVTLLCVLFIEVAKLARAKAADPLLRIRLRFLPRLPLLLIPAVAFPTFLVGFTATKSAIPFIVGYSWDHFWANADRLIFGVDVWRITHSLFGSGSLWFWQWFYTVAWGAVFFISATAIPLYASRKFIATFFGAMFATWLLGGFVLAYVFSAAGPVFAQIFDPALAKRFTPLRTELTTNLGNGPIALTQHYLAGSLGSHAAVMGGGISAMPSMHLAAAAIYVFASRGTKWFFPSVAFSMIIFIASAYFGYHYWVDGIAAAAIAWICWKVSLTAIVRLTADARPALVAREPS